MRETQREGESERGAAGRFSMRSDAYPSNVMHQKREEPPRNIYGPRHRTSTVPNPRLGPRQLQQIGRYCYTEAAECHRPSCAWCDRGGGDNWVALRAAEPNCADRLHQEPSPERVKLS